MREREREEEEERGWGDKRFSFVCFDWYRYELYRVRALTNAPINSTVKSSVLKNMVNMMNQADLVKDTLESLSIHRHPKHKETGTLLPSHHLPRREKREERGERGERRDLAPLFTPLFVSPFIPCSFFLPESHATSAAPMPHPFASQPVHAAPLATPFAHTHAQAHPHAHAHAHARHNTLMDSDDEGLLVNASVEPISEPPLFEQPMDLHPPPTSCILSSSLFPSPSPPSSAALFFSSCFFYSLPVVAPETDFNPRQRAHPLVDPLIEIDELADDDDLLDQLDELDDEMDFAQMRR